MIPNTNFMLVLYYQTIQSEVAFNQILISYLLFKQNTFGEIGLNHVTKGN